MDTSNKTQKLVLSIKAKNLTNVAGFNQISDPYAEVSIHSFLSQTRTTLGRTETVKNTLSPDWAKAFPTEYEFGTSTNVLVALFDERRGKKNYKMGEVSFDMNDLVGAKAMTMAMEIKQGGKKAGVVIIRADPFKGTGTLRLQMNGSNLKCVETGLFNGKSDPFFQLMKKELAPSGLFEWNTVYRSAFIDNNLNPSWKADTIELSALCDGNLDAPVMITVADNDKKGKHTHMGKAETTVNRLVSAQGQAGFVLMNEKGKDVGKLVIVEARVVGHRPVTMESQMAGMSVSPTAPPHVPAVPMVASAFAVPNIPMVASASTVPRVPMVASASTVPRVPMVASAAPVIFNPMVASPAPVIFNPTYAPFVPPPPSRPTFLDYLNGGCEVQLNIAIDFTGSNGNPSTPGTLHYLSPDPNHKNDYEKAILAIGGALAHYDSDKKFQVWGFGAKYNQQIYHIFRLTGAVEEADGVAGVIDAYHQTFRTGLVMSSPTDITQVISTAADLAKKAQAAAQSVGKNKYSILLILTDGAVSDINATLGALRAAGDAPLSIVIVGIGNADFSAMQRLDDYGAGTPINDIVQFVEFNAHRHDSNSLTKATLEEIPDQLVAYFQRNSVEPSPPEQVMEEDIPVTPQEEEIDLSVGSGAVSGGVFIPGRVF